MADHEHDALDDRLRRGLADASTGAAHTVRPTPASGIRRSAARRQAAALVGVVTAVLVVGGGAAAVTGGLDPLGFEPALPPSTVPPSTTSPAALPTRPTTAPPTAPATSPVQTSTPPTTVTAEPEDPPLAPPSPPPSPTVGPWPAGSPATEIPPGLRLPHEGEASGGEGFTDWITDDQLDAPWRWAPCGRDRYDGDAARTDNRRVSQSGSESVSVIGLTVWGDAFEAVDVMADMRAAVASCVDRTEDFTTFWEAAPLDIGGESFIARSYGTTSDGSQMSGGDLVVVVRVGNAIFTTWGFADGSSAFEGGYSQVLRQEAIDFAPNMCVFTMAGCRAS